MNVHIYFYYKGHKFSPIPLLYFDLIIKLALDRLMEEKQIKFCTYGGSPKTQETPILI